MNQKRNPPANSPAYADLIVVGGGLSGLAAATYAAKSGRAVTLFEKASQPGGRAITRQRSGFSLNLGAHALYHQSEAGEVLRELGVAYSGMAGRDAGVHIVSNTRVVAIEHKERVQGVRLVHGDLYPAEAVIVATDPATASALVDTDEYTTLRRWAREAVPSHVACLDVALRRLPEPRHTGALSIERPLNMVVHSASARLAPEGGALIHTIRYLEPGESPDPHALEQELAALLDRLQPGWQRELVERQFLPHMYATNAIVQARLGGLSGRPGPEVPGIRNLYVAGDWVGTAGQLTAAGLASARQAAHLACTQARSPAGAARAQ